MNSGSSSYYSDFVADLVVQMVLYSRRGHKLSLHHHHLTETHLASHTVGT
jgi:hypothetical protein